MIEVGDIVRNRYNKEGQVFEEHKNYWDQAKNNMSMSAQEWLDRQTIPFTKEQIEEKWFTVATFENGGTITSPESLLELIEKIKLPKDL